MEFVFWKVAGQRSGERAALERLKGGGLSTGLRNSQERLGGPPRPLAELLEALGNLLEALWDVLEASWKLLEASAGLLVHFLLRWRFVTDFHWIL